MSVEEKRGNVYYLKPKTTVSRGEVDEALNSISDQGGNKILRATLCKCKLTQLEIKKAVETTGGKDFWDIRQDSDPHAEGAEGRAYQCRWVKAIKVKDQRESKILWATL